jgi:hypothetical protein
LSLASEVFIPLDHEGEYAWETTPVVLPDRVKSEGTGVPGYGISYRVTDGTAEISDLEARPVFADSGRYSVRVTFTASNPSDGARLEIVDVSASATY